MKRKQCDKCGGIKFSYNEELSTFSCKKCNISFLDPEWSKVIQDKRIIDTHIRKSKKSPVAVNTGDGDVYVTIGNNSKSATVSNWLKIVASLITIGVFVVTFVVPRLLNEDHDPYPILSESANHPAPPLTPATEPKLPVQRQLSPIQLDGKKTVIAGSHSMVIMNDGSLLACA